MSNVRNERHFKSEGRVETQTLKWEVKDLLSLVKDDSPLRLEHARLEFDAGQSIGLRSKWCCSLHTDSWFNVHLKLLKCSTVSVLANFQCCIKKANGDAFLGREAAMGVLEGYQFKEGTYKSTINFYREPFERILPNLKKELVNGSLMIEIRFQLSHKNFLASKEIGINIATTKNESRLAVVEDLQKLLDSGENADIIIEPKDAKGKKLKAHKLILAARSPVFYAMFQNNMKEVSTGTIFIDDLSYEAMSIILKFIYSGAIDDKWENFAEEIVQAAEKYCLPRLKGFCDHFLINTCSIENSMDLLKLSRLYNLKVAEEKILAFISGNLRVIL